MFEKAQTSRQWVGWVLRVACLAGIWVAFVLVFLLLGIALITAPGCIARRIDKGIRIAGSVGITAAPAAGSFACNALGPGRSPSPGRSPGCEPCRCAADHP